MSVDNDVVKAGDGALGRQPPSSAGTTTVVSAAAVEQQTVPPPKVDRCGGDEENADRDETVRLLGEPLTSHGPYTFYSALAYRDRGDDSCCCSAAEWSVVRMNHFYAVRPWYSKRDSCATDRKLADEQRRGRRKKSPTSRAAAKERREHHHQQSVFIGELELLWRDETVAVATAKSASNGDSTTTTTTASGSNSSNSTHGGRGGAGSSDDETAGTGRTTAAAAAAAAGSPTPHRRMLPRRRRQPSAKKLEAAESYAADRGHSLYRRNRAPSAAVLARHQFPSPPHYAHGNLLCSVRLYVMPDQTSVGRLSGVHGEDEVLEINTWGASGGGGGGADVNAFVNGCGEYGGDSAGAHQSRYSGLVLRVEDFVEWVRGGLMNQDGNDDDDDTDKENESSGAEDDASAAKSSAEVAVDDKTGKKTAVKTESNWAAAASKDDAKKFAARSLGEVDVKEEQREEGGVAVAPAKDGRRHWSVASVFGEAVDAESVPLAAADIFKKRVNVKKESLMNGGDSASKRDEPMAEDQKSATVDIKKCDVVKGRTKTKSCSDKQQLVVMSYSRYCRYRARLQRSLEERRIVRRSCDTSLVDSAAMDTIRVLFCRDTYDYPAELLLQPFNPLPHGYQQKSSVLANHMAPKLRGWPSYPASWMSFRWNRVRRLLRRIERGNGGSEEQRRLRRRRKKLNKSRRRYIGSAGGTTTVALGYSSSTDSLDYSDTDDEDDGSSATNDGACTNATTSDSEGMPPSAVTAKAAAAAVKNSAPKENGGGNRPRAIVSSAGGVFFVNGTTTTVSTVVTANKRPAAATVSGQTSALQQQPTKRRCIVYASSPTTGQQSQIRALYPPQQQQHPWPRMPQQLSCNRQLHQFSPRLQLNRRLPAPVASLQPRATAARLVNLPPSVSILPVVTPGTKNVAVFQQLQRQRQFVHRLPPPGVRPAKQPSVSQSQIVSIIGRRQQQQQQHTSSLSPVVIEYAAKSGQKNNNSNNKNVHALAATTAGGHRRVQCIDLEEQEHQEDDKKQRQWLVDALRLGGLEVTAVPLKKKTGEEETGKGSLQQQARLKRDARPGDREKPAEETRKDGEEDCGGNGESNRDSDTDSIVMTVTPDVISMLNKTSGQRQPLSVGGGSSSFSSSAPAAQQRPAADGAAGGGCGQRVAAAAAPGVAVVTAPALHDKINRAIDSLKQQIQQTTTSSNERGGGGGAGGTTVLAMVASSPRSAHNNNNNNAATEEPRQRKIVATGTNRTCQQQLQQTFVKPGGKRVPPQKHLPSVQIKINAEPKQQKREPAAAGSPTPTPTPTPTNVGISIVPTTLAVAYVTKVQTQRLQIARATTVPRNVPAGGSPEASTSMSVKQQLQRRIVSKPPALTPIVGAWSSASDRQLHHYRQQCNNNSSNSTLLTVTTAEPPLLPRQQQIIILASPAANASQPSNDKICPQQKKKD